MTGVAVLGSTGSIGRQALEVIAGLGDRFEVQALAAGHAGEAFSAQLAAWPGARASSKATARARRRTSWTTSACSRHRGIAWPWWATA